VSTNHADHHLVPTAPGRSLVPAGLPPDPVPALPAIAEPAPSPAAPAGVPLPGAGDRIGQYEIIRELGRGGMGAVYIARDTRLGRRVAFKIMLTDRSDLAARFLVEAQATARCQHEHIVVIHDVGEHRRYPYIVLESCVPVKKNGQQSQWVMSLLVPRSCVIVFRMCSWTRERK
jgi:Protein kinase domain